MQRLIFIFFLILSWKSLIGQQTNYKIGFSQPLMADEWRKTMYNEMQRQLIFHEDIELIFRDADTKTSTQITQILEMVELGIDLLIVSPNEAAPLTPIIESIYDQGIPVIILDRRIPSNKYTAYIGADNQLIGSEGGKYLVRLLQGKGRVLEIYESLRITAFADRHQGFRSVIEQYPSLEVDSVKAIAKGEEKYRQMIGSNEYQAVFAPTDVAAKFAVDVAKEEGVSTENSFFIGIDALPGEGNGLDLVERGILTATILYPTGGDVAIDVASKILNGEKYDKENTLQTLVIDSTNVAIIQTQARKILKQQSDILSLADKLGVIQRVFKTQRTLTYLFAATMILSIIMTAFVLKSLTEKRRINKELQLKNDQITEYASKAEEATQAKFRFFTNISHEFRTPLTLIKAPIEEMLNSKDTGAFKRDLNLVKRNTMRLLRLVNQIMDFRKIDSASMSLRIGEHELIPFLEEILYSFEKLAKNKGVAIKLIYDEDDSKLWFDASMMDKVFFNLLSNAFKFTREGGEIYVRVEKDNFNDQVKISVEDSGTGMNEEQVVHIFDRFYQGDQHRSLGTGIGLSLSKEIVELHQGIIKVESVLGRGTRFDILLKKGNQHFNASSIVSERAIYERTTDSFFDDLESHDENEKPTPDGSNVLIIEDNEELRAFLQRKINLNHQVRGASNVSEGLEIAKDEVPDLIICDLMLNNESGFEIISALKEDLRTSHIPIIILTAKSDQKEKLKGIKMGADDYITKPFDMALLLERINTLLANRQKLREHYLHELPIEQKTNSGSKIDKRFVSEFTALVEQNLSNPDFGVNELGKEMGLSRMQLYRKVKALLGYSVNDYITSVRLKKAKHLILQDEYTISEIAHAVGYSTPSYFSTAFKNQFGISPSEFKSQL